MKHMKGSIDILWLDEDCRIVGMKEKVPPCTSEPCPTYTSDKQASMVLEIASGTIQRLRLEDGAVCSVSPSF